MRTQKTKIMDLPFVYSTAELSLEGKGYLVAASEAVGEHAYIIDPDTLQYSDLWLGDTGVMDVVQIPGRNQLVAITKFYPIFQSKAATVCLLEPTDRGVMSPWKITEVLQLPFCHRIGVVKNENGMFLIGCQLCRDKDFQEDWTKPGAIWMAPIPETPNGEWKLTRVFEGLTKNHGLFIQDDTQVYISSENGVMLFDMTRYQAGDTLWPQVISTTPTSDVWIARGKDETVVGAIEPFHGNTLSIYVLTDARYLRRTAFAIDFGHVVWAGQLFGQSAVIAGSRGGNKALEVIFWRTGERVILDEGVGSTQITVWVGEKSAQILSANHGAGEVSQYILTPY